VSRVTGSALRPEHPLPRSLATLASDFSLPLGDAQSGIEVSGVSVASGGVEPGDLYVGLPGRNAHGASFWREAQEAGAAAILTDAEGAALAAGCSVPVLVTADPRSALGEISAWIYRTDDNPATLFAVTGTNGKTSVVYLLTAILAQLGVLTGLSSTAERRIGRTAVASRLTTPEASELHALLARMREEEVRAVAVEVSAQALTRHRVDGLVFDVAGFTNLSHDHLDDYESMEPYFAAKLELFQPERSRRAVIDVDSEWGRRLADLARVPSVTLASSPAVDATWRVAVTEETLDSTAFVLTGPDGRRLEARVPLLGAYMATNAALAVVMLVESGFDLDAIAHALGPDGAIDVHIPGRMERIPSSGPAVFIDYGHTPEAFRSTLAALRSVAPGRVIMVFGADGDRDATKRHDMGAIAARGSDVVVVTDFHPRFEDPATIRAALLEGARSAEPEGELYEIPDPRAALRHALALASPDDVVYYAGPGHEDYREIAGVRVPYSALEDARLALDEAGWAA